MIDLEEARGRLREWAYVFRDRRTKGQAGSAEGMWRSPQVWDPPAPRATIQERQAYATHEVLRAIPVPSYRVLTWRYCAPWVPVAIPLRHLSRRLGYRVTLKDYEELILLGEYAVAAKLEEQRRDAEIRTLIQRAVA